MRDGEVIGMTWLAVIPRVPSARRFERGSGDLQCAYVLPGERDGGVDSRLIEAILARAAALDLERVTVHSSPRATTLYRRHGFTAEDDRLMHAMIAY
jgi:ribosomal protein S18 acetylase RimI-like enzyme